MKKYIQKIYNKENLTQGEMEEIMHALMSAEVSKDDMAGFLLALRAKGPTVEEITGAAKIMREFVIPVVSKSKDILDTCGTGGDKKGTFNISTIVAIVVAGAGVTVAKHGNRSVSSRCGSADILEKLGININMDEKRLGECLDGVGIAFLFAQKLHPAMKNVALVRKELGVETIFNLLGPLTNPASATHQMMGVYSRDLVEPMVQVLKNLGLKTAVVVHGNDGLDEITTTTNTFITEYRNGEVVSYDIDPRELGVDLAKDADLKGGDAETNLKIFEEVLAGKRSPRRDVVVVNAAYAFYAASRVDDIAQGMILAQESIDSGNASKKLDQLRKFTNE